MQIQNSKPSKYSNTWVSKLIFSVSVDYKNKLAAWHTLFIQKQTYISKTDSLAIPVRLHGTCPSWICSQEEELNIKWLDMKRSVQEASGDHPALDMYLTATASKGSCARLCATKGRYNPKSAIFYCAPLFLMEENSFLCCSVPSECNALMFCNVIFYKHTIFDMTHTKQLWTACRSSG